MAFNSFNFWFIFPIVFLLYWAIPAKWNMWRKMFLVIVSYLLYMNWKPAFALVLLGVTLVTYCGGRFLSLELQVESKEVIVKSKKDVLHGCSHCLDCCLFWYLSIIIF